MTFQSNVSISSAREKLYHEQSLKYQIVLVF